MSSDEGCSEVNRHLISIADCEDWTNNLISGCSSEKMSGIDHAVSRQSNENLHDNWGSSKLNTETTVSNAVSKSSMVTVTTTTADKPERRFVSKWHNYKDKQHEQRIMSKSGECHVTFEHVSLRRRRYLRDIFTTLLDMRWRYQLSLFALAFCCSWLLFAFAWWVITVPLARPDAPCVVGVYDFLTALLFSIETQHTIGYGSRAMTSACPHAVIAVMLQSVVGVLIQCIMAGVVFAKLSRAKGRAATLMFSRNAVICRDKDDLCLMFRIGDMRYRSQILGATMRALLIHRPLAVPRRANGNNRREEPPWHKRKLELEALPGGGDFLLLSWPTTVVHRINVDSPLWKMDAATLRSLPIEIVVVMEGVVEATDMATQVCTSYTTDEILWGHRLEPLVCMSPSHSQRYKIDYSKFHSILPQWTPHTSAHEQACCDDLS